MPRQRIHHSRRPHGFPVDFPEHLVRFKDKSRLTWAEIDHRLDVHHETMRRWREKGMLPNTRTMQRSSKWRTPSVPTTCSETEQAQQPPSAPGRCPDPLQHCLEIQALVDAQAGLAEAGQPLPQGLVFLGRLPSIPHPLYLRPSTDSPRLPSPPGLRNECISLTKNYTGGKLAGNWSEIGVLSSRLSTDFTQHSVSHCYVIYSNLRWGSILLAFDKPKDAASRNSRQPLLGAQPERLLTMI